MTIEHVILGLLLICAGVVILGALGALYIAGKMLLELAKLADEVLGRKE